MEYWPISQIVADFYREIGKPGALCFVAKRREVIGFTWGYDVSISSQLAAELEAPELGHHLAGEFFYLDECALALSHQGQGIGKQLVEQIFRAKAQERVLLRTMGNSRMYQIIKKLGGTVVQEISRGRVIMQLLAA